MRALCIGLVFLFSTGCVVVGDVDTAVDDLVIEESLDMVVIEVGAGDVDVMVDPDAKTTSVRRIAQYTGEPPRTRHRVVDGVLELQVECNAGFAGTCSVDHEVVLPATAAVVVTAGSGDVVVDGADSIDVETGSGDVLAGGLRSVGEVDTGSGDVSLGFSSRPDRVIVGTGSGDVDINVPPGVYDVDVDTGSGDVAIINITVDAKSDRVLDVETGSGDVAIIGG